MNGLYTNSKTLQNQTSIPYKYLVIFIFGALVSRTFKIKL